MMENIEIQLLQVKQKKMQLVIYKKFKGLKLY